MYLKNETVESIIKSVLEEEKVAGAGILTQKIMNRLVTIQREIAQQGSKSSSHPKKRVNMDKVRKQLAARIDLTTIAASQKVSLSTLQKRLKDRE